MISRAPTRDSAADSRANAPRLLAFYLPQFHPIPENDAWWGAGFTEWRHVILARPQFRGHHQPHLPADLGFYDLRVPEVREAQAALARAYGISGFCYYHYWFNGKRLLGRPFDEVFRSRNPDFPFCLCWANENWTRRWDGYDQDVLMSQKHSPADDRAHIDYLVSIFRDPRYITIDGRPLFLVYRTDLLPDPIRTATLWRERAQAAGFRDLYLARVESFAYIDPRKVGFDASVEFAPDKAVVSPTFCSDLWTPLLRLSGRLVALRRLSQVHRRHTIYSYEELARGMLAKPAVPFTRFRGVTPGWDNTPRRRQGAIIFRGSRPELYEWWLHAALQDTLAQHGGEDRILFINAWNEWSEGNHLEPDQRWGHAYLEATARAVAATTARW